MSASRSNEKPRIQQILIRLRKATADEERPNILKQKNQRTRSESNEKTKAPRSLENRMKLCRPVLK